MNDNTQPVEISTIEGAIQEMARRISSDFFLQYVRGRVDNKENLKIILKIKKGSNQTGYAISLKHITETTEKTLGVLTHLK